MPTPLRGGLLLLFCLLSVATSASAECAWVLWTRLATVKPAHDGEWSTDTPPEVYPTYAACQARITVASGVPEPGSLADWRDWMSSGGQYARSEVYAFRDHSMAKVIIGSTSTYWSCLPDTVDPRGPKGK